MATAGLDAAPSGMPAISGSNGVRTSATMGTQNADRALELNQQYVTPSYPDGQYQRHIWLGSDDPGNRPTNLPNWYPNGTSQLPVSYVGPSAAKDNLARRQAIRDGINASIAAGAPPPGVQRTDPITDEEVQYLKYMEDTSELAKFDQYVESFIDPRQPGSMKFLMEVYPEYVNRRLQQAHADYEFALRNQMIDSWGINTFDDLYFKYMVDQGKLQGPHLTRPGKKLADKYAPGILSYMAFATKFDNQDELGLPFTSAKTGRRPTRGTDWSILRRGPFTDGGTRQEMANAMYAMPDDATLRVFNGPSTTQATMPYDRP
jgi:hypothetical protein